jgi:DHA1 family bicyclomycin/chloramphenicol resistance-like MFS transporter
MLQPLSTDLYLASLPAMADYFSVAPAVVQQTLSQFVLGFAGAQLISGPLSDRFGRRPVLFGGLAIYLLATQICTFASNMDVLIVGRFLQAIGCCTGVVVARAIIRDAWPPAQGGQIIARVSGWMGLAPLLGPIVGGYLQVAFGWRAAFVVHSLAAGVLVFAVLKFAETNHQLNLGALRPRGFIANYQRVLGAPAFWAYAIPGALSYCSIFVFISGVSFVLIKVLAVPTQYFGFCFAFGVSGYLIGTLLCRRLMQRLGVSKTLHVGAWLAVSVSLAFAATVALGMIHWITVLIAQFLVMFAHGINFPCAQTGAVAPFAERAGTAAGLLGSLAMLAAFFTGNLVGNSHDGTLVPLSLLSAGVGLLLFAADRLLTRYREDLGEA